MICQVEGCTTHYGCRLRAKSISLSSAATPSRTPKLPYRPPRQPSWEKGIEGQHRPGGYFMPTLNDKGKPMGVYEAQTHRKRIEDTRRRYASHTPLED